jgi:hypothetical protein
VVVSQSTTPNNSFCTQYPFLGINDQIVQCPCEQTPFPLTSNMDEPMDGKQLDVVIQMESYMPFDTTKG